MSQSSTTGDITTHHSADGLAEIRAALDRLRADIDAHRAELPLADTLTAMVSDADTRLDDPTGPNEGPLRALAHALPALVAGTAVQEAGHALATALGGLLG